LVLLTANRSTASGFSYPYYLYVPRSILRSEGTKRKHTILVIPNNAGKTSDSLEVHEADVRRKMGQNKTMTSNLEVVILTPVFPRPATDWKIYTHALDRDSMITDKKEYRRLDLQLGAMIDHARARLKAENVRTDKRVVMLGFSASGMFVNRFTFLHPERVKAAAIGSPGGWAIAPARTFKGRPLRYPIGVADLKEVAGEDLALGRLRKLPLFIFLGGEDDNDSVIFGDGYEPEDKELIFNLFGKTPVERWEVSKRLYQSNRLNAEFKLYPNVKHSISAEMFSDIFQFLRKYVN
jgi:pimeloyl-ACP methyl ester carboxylesterase